MTPGSPRLRYVALSPASLPAFHRLVVDPHVRRYMMDGRTMPQAWSREEVARSERLFAQRSVGLWLLHERARDAGEPIGFAGFRVFEEMSPEPQLLYAFPASATGCGYATEAAGALLRFVADPAGPGWDEVIAAVDAPNTASSRVLAKLGFERTGEVPGAFGTTTTYRWRRSAGPG